MCVKAYELVHKQTGRSFGFLIKIIGSKRCVVSGEEFIFEVRPNCACKAILKNLGEKEVTRIPLNQNDPSLIQNRK